MNSIWSVEIRIELCGQKINMDKKSKKSIDEIDDIKKGQRDV